MGGDKVITVDKDAERYDDFMCACGGEESKESRRSADVLATAKELIAGEVTDANFLTAVVYELEWSYGAHIDSIHCDQWCAVTAVKKEFAKDERGEWDYDAERVTVFRTRIQCDLVEHGVAATYLAFRSRFGASDGVER